MPAKVSPVNDVPDNIDAPPYYKSKIVPASPFYSEIKNQVQIEGMRQSCQLAREILDSLHGIVQVCPIVDIALPPGLYQNIISPLRVKTELPSSIINMLEVAKVAH